MNAVDKELCCSADYFDLINFHFKTQSRIPSLYTFLIIHTMELIKDLPDRLLFAVPKKGRLHSSCLSLLEGAEIQFHRKNRLDIALVKNLPIALVFLPAGDIAKFVGEGNVDLGITGQDMVAEARAEDKVTEILELGFGKCRLCVQVPVKGGPTKVEDLVGKRIATSFEGISGKFFNEVDARVAAANGTPEKKTELVFVSGSVEAACALGLADGIGKDLRSVFSSKSYEQCRVQDSNGTSNWINWTCIEYLFDR